MFCESYLRKTNCGETFPLLRETVVGNVALLNKCLAVNHLGSAQQSHFATALSSLQLKSLSMSSLTVQ